MINERNDQIKRLERAGVDLLRSDFALLAE